MLKGLRAELDSIREKKHKSFKDFDSLIIKIAESYASLFPNFSRNCKGSHCVYNFRIPGLYPFTVVREHRSREFQHPKSAKGLINKIADILDYVEASVPSAPRMLSEGDLSNEPADNVEKTSRVLPESEIPDGDGGG